MTQNLHGDELDENAAAAAEEQVVATGNDFSYEALMPDSIPGMDKGGRFLRSLGTLDPVLGVVVAKISRGR